MKSLVFSSFLALGIAACSSDPSKTAPAANPPAQQPPSATTPAKPDAPKADAAKAEAAKAEAAKAEAAKAEAAKAEAAKAAEGAKPEAAKPAGGAVDMDADIKTLMAKPEHTEPAIQVQHILISFGGSGTKATRSKADAEKLAKEVYAQVMAGGDFDALVKKYTDDSAPGKYDMTNGSTRTPGAYPRAGMVPAFGNVGWRLKVGDVGVAPFDPKNSPYGWHIVKRTK